jgi:hypothetical protein
LLYRWWLVQALQGLPETRERRAEMAMTVSMALMALMGPTALTDPKVLRDQDRPPFKSLIACSPS